MADQEPEAPEGWPPWVHEIAVPLLSEPMVWPLLFTAVGIVSVLLSVVVLGVVRGGLLEVAAGGALAVICGSICHTERRRSGRLGPVTAVVAGLWALAALVAAVLGGAGLV